jgi:hypothetical protein
MCFVDTSKFGWLLKKMENLNEAAVLPQPTVPVKDTLSQKCVVIDTGAIVKGETKSFHKYASRFYTCQEVLQEVRDLKSREILASLPFELEIRTPSEKAMQIVYNFAKKTGDFAALSLCDLKIIALTYDLELEAHQQQFLREAPLVRVSHHCVAYLIYLFSFLSHLCLSLYLSLSAENQSCNSSKTSDT